MTSVSSRVFDSRASNRPGWGFPSCNTELCRIPVNRHDPHGYYHEVGVEPGATDEQIRTRVRQLYRELHPDTGTRPDPDRLQRVRLIAGVLLDPTSREKYNRTPPGKRLLDVVYRSELSVMDLADLPREEAEKLLRPVSPPPPRPERRDFDFLSVGLRPRDSQTAQLWYKHLVAVAPLVGYRRRIKVLLHDDIPLFYPDSSVLAIPRSWTPSTGAAFALFVAVAGQEHPAWRWASVSEEV